MPRLYAASALLLLSLPQGFAVPLAQELPPFQLLNATSPVHAATAPTTGEVSVPTDPIVFIDPILPSEPLDVSDLTGGVITTNDEPFETTPLDPNIGDGTFTDVTENELIDTAPIPIENGIGDGSGPEAFGDPPAVNIAAPAEPSAPVDTILIDPIQVDVPVILEDPAADITGPTTIADAILPPIAKEVPGARPLSPQTLELSSFVSILQQLANVISSFFTVIPGETTPPVPIVSNDASSFMDAAAAAKPAFTPSESGGIVGGVTPILPSQVGSSRLRRQMHSLSSPESTVLGVLPTSTLTSLFKPLLNIATGLLGRLPPDTVTPKNPVGSVFGGLGKRDALTQEQKHLLAVATAKNAELKKAIDELKTQSQLIKRQGLGGRSEKRQLPVDASALTGSLKTIVKALDTIISLTKNVPIAGGSTDKLLIEPASLTNKLPVGGILGARGVALHVRQALGGLGGLRSIGTTVSGATKPVTDVAKTTLPLDLLNNVLQLITTILDLSLPVDLPLTQRDESTPLYRHQTADQSSVRAFIRKWHTVGASLAHIDPSLVQELMDIFMDPSSAPTLDDASFLRRFPEQVRDFVLEYFDFAQVLVDSNVPKEDKIEILKVMFDGSALHLDRKRLKKRDTPIWSADKVKNFIRLFWEYGPGMLDLSEEQHAALFAPFNDVDYNNFDATVDSKAKDRDSQAKDAAWLSNRFEKLLEGLSDDEKADLYQVLVSVPLPPDRKRSMRHGLRRRQSEDGYPDEGVELDDMPKFGPEAIKYLLGPSGSLDPLDLSQLSSKGDFADHYTIEETSAENLPSDSEATDYSFEATDEEIYAEDVDSTSEDSYDEDVVSRDDWAAWEPLNGNHAEGVDNYVDDTFGGEQAVDAHADECASHNAAGGLVSPSSSGDIDVTELMNVEMIQTELQI